MVLLQQISDPVMVQILCDALAARCIEYRVENAGMNALMPLPGSLEWAVRPCTVTSSSISSS